MATTDGAVPESPATTASPTAAPSRWALAAAVTAPLAAGITLAVARWAGGSPFGSDNDEYRLLASSLWHHSIEIAGVEGTKYPIGYSAVLGLLDRLGLPLTGTALAINVALVAVLAALVWRIASCYGGLLPASTAATVTVLSAGLWNSVYVTMPDLAFVVVVAAVLLLTTPEPDRRRVIALLALVICAVLLKSLGITLGIAVSAWLLTQPRWRRWCWTPTLAALTVVGLQAAWSSTAPEHTTGYKRSFWLSDQFDASLGRIGLLDLPSRMWNQLDTVVTDVGEAVFGSQHASVWLGLAGLALAAIGAVVLRDRLAFTATFFIVYSFLLLVWAGSSPRFGLAFLPWAAVGVGVSVQAIARKTNTAIAIAVAALLIVPYGLDARSHAAETATAESTQVTQLEAAIAAVDTWLTTNTEPGAIVAAPDYRELAYRTDRTYVPIPYTLDTDELWRVTGESGAQWLVVLKGIYPNREKVVANLVASRPDQIIPVAETNASTIYKLCPDQACP